MIRLNQIFILLLSTYNSISNEKTKNKSFEDIIFESDSKIITNAENKIGSFEFEFKKAYLQKKNIVKNIIKLYNIFKSKKSVITFKTWASITIFDHLQLKKVREDEVTKIIRFISECKENEKFLYEPNSVFKLEVMKINNNIKDDKFLYLLSKHEEFYACKGKNYIPYTYCFLIYEDISKNDIIKKSMRIKLSSFIENCGKNLYECTDFYILLIGSFRNYHHSLLKHMYQQVSKYNDINKYLTKIMFSFSEIFNQKTNYSINTFNLRIFTNGNQNIFDSFHVKKKKVFNRTYKLDRNQEKPNLLNYFGLSTSYISFKIEKLVYEMDSGEKLFNLLGYGPNINKFHISLSNLKDCKIKINYDVLVFIEKNESYLYNYNEIQEESFTKKIIISNVIDDNCTEIINFSYEINNEELIGFPLTTIERLKIEELSESNNNEAQKLANFINLYESFVFGIDYFYFYLVYTKELCLIDKISFYNREAVYNDISKSKIDMLISNSCKFKYNISMARKHAILKNVKSINIFHFERKILNNLNNKEEKHYHNVLKGLKNHFIDQIELKFYDNVKNLIPSHLSRDNNSINFFINIDFGLNKEYLIIFKESSYRDTGCKEFYDIKFLHEKVFETLESDFLKILPSLDINSLQNQLKLFTNLILEILKEDLFDNIEIESGLCIKLKSEINSFAPILHETILNYCNICDDTENKKINDKNMEKNIIFERILNELILIIRKSFIEKRYESCVLASLANEKNESNMILQSLLQNY